MTEVGQTLTDAIRNIYTRIQGSVETLRNVITQCAPPNLLTHCDLNGQVVIVTGSDTGIGRKTAEALVARGVHVVLACINTAGAEKAAEGMRALPRLQGCQAHSVEVAHIDLASLASVRAFAADFNARGLSLSVLVCNAGLMAPPERIETEDGLEQQFQVNYLGHWLLAHLLLTGQQHLRSSSGKHHTAGQTHQPKHLHLIAATGHTRNHQRRQQHDLPAGKDTVMEVQHTSTRVVVVASMTHGAGRIKFDDLQATQSYSGFQRYADSKLADLLAVRSFAQRMTRAGQGRAAQDSICAVHPGLVQTQLSQQWLYNGCPIKALRCVVDMLFPWAFLHPDYAVATLLHAITATADEVHGKYIAFSRVVKPSKLAMDDESARRLWDVSCQLTSISDQEMYVSL